MRSLTNDAFAILSRTKKELGLLEICTQGYGEMETIIKVHMTVYYRLHCCGITIAITNGVD